jgi:hypothetical protein
MLITVQVTAWEVMNMSRTDCIRFSPHDTTAPIGLGTPHYRGLMITYRHTTVGRTPLDEWSTRRRDLYLTTHNPYKRQASMVPARFEPAIPANKRPQTHPRLRPRSNWDRHLCTLQGYINWLWNVNIWGSGIWYVWGTVKTQLRWERH